MNPHQSISIRVDPYQSISIHINPCQSISVYICLFIYIYTVLISIYLFISIQYVFFHFSSSINRHFMRHVHCAWQDLVMIEEAVLALSQPGEQFTKAWTKSFVVTRNAAGIFGGFWSRNFSGYIFGGKNRRSRNFSGLKFWTTR